jgi:hypothetical protein
MGLNPAWESHSLEVARKRRAELRDSMLVLERTLAAPAPGHTSDWADLVRASLRQLQADVREHLAVTEGPDGLYQDILSSAPRLANAVRRLLDEHRGICAVVDGLVAEAEAGVARDADRVCGLRERANLLLGQLLRHRQRGADLVFEAYATDIGGET